MPSVNYYEVLEISRDASEAEIKKAYRALSLKWHPDRNPSPEAHGKIQEINAAYETLSDAGKRQAYNNELDGVPPHPFGPGGPFGAGGPGGPGGPPPEMAHFFNMFFGQGGMPFGAGGHGGPGIHIFHTGPGGPHVFHQIHKPPPVVRTVPITLEQAYHGCAIQIDMERQATVNGEQVTQVESAHVNIPQGTDNGDVIVVQNMGTIATPEIRGDLKIVIQIDNTTPFIRNGLDLIYKKHVSLKEALVGFSFEITHISGKLINLNNINNRTIIKPDYQKTLPGLGMIRNGQTGNLIVDFSVDFPDSLTEEQTNMLSNIL